MAKFGFAAEGFGFNDGGAYAALVADSAASQEYSKLVAREWFDSQLSPEFRHQAAGDLGAFVSSEFFTEG